MSSISIITVVKNGMPQIQDCLQSVKNQTRTADEHIVIDGQSTDGTLQILGNHSNIVFFSEVDRGISHAFNKAWKHSQSEYICHLNSDDWIEPDHLEKIYNLIEDFDPDIIISNLYFDSDKNQRILKPNYPKFGPKMKWPAPQINHPGMVIRKSLIENIGGYKEDFKIAMDVDLFYRLLTLSPKIHFNNSATVHQRDGGVSQKQWVTTLQELKTIEIIYGRSKTTAVLSFYWRMMKSIIKQILKSLVQL